MNARLRRHRNPADAISFRVVLAADRDTGTEFATEAIRTCLGDRYLISNNPIHRSVRRAALALGYTFSREPPYGYHDLPLLSLDDMYDSRVIGFRDNVTPIERLEAKPHDYSLRELESAGLRSNACLHESAHAIAHDALSQLHASTDRNTQLFAIVFTESIANATEALASVYVDSPLHDVLHRINSHLSLSPRSSAAARRLLRIWTPVEVFRVLFCGYLASNMLWKSADVEAIDDFLSGANTSIQNNDRAAQRDARVLFRSGFRLSVDFRLRSTQVYLRGRGYLDSVFSLLDFDPLPFLREASALRALADLSDAIASTSSRR